MYPFGFSREILLLNLDIKAFSTHRGKKSRIRGSEIFSFEKESYKNVSLLRVGNWLLSCLKCPAEQKVYLVNE
jgi:hypothetical protein